MSSGRMSGPRGQGRQGTGVLLSLCHGGRALAADWRAPWRCCRPGPRWGEPPAHAPGPAAEKAREAAGATGKTLDSHQHPLSSLLILLTFFLLFMLFFFYTLVVIYLTIYFSFW